MNFASGKWKTGNSNIIVSSQISLAIICQYLVIMWSKNVGNDLEFELSKKNHADL